MPGSARCSARRPEAGVDAASEADLALLDEDELALVKLAAQFPRIVEAAAAAHEPHRIAFYLGDLAAAFHAHVEQGQRRPRKAFPRGTESRFDTRAAGIGATRIGQIVRNGLGIMGVTAAEEMR